MGPGDVGTAAGCIDSSLNSANYRAIPKVILKVVVVGETADARR